MTLTAQTALHFPSQRPSPAPEATGGWVTASLTAPSSSRQELQIDEANSAPILEASGNKIHLLPGGKGRALQLVLSKVQYAYRVRVFCRGSRIPVGEAQISPNGDAVVRLDRLTAPLTAGSRLVIQFQMPHAA